MVEWLVANWLPLLIVIIAVIGLVVYFVKKKGLRQLATDAIVWAEKEFSTESGKEKMQNAIDYCQQWVPFLKFIPDSMIESFLQAVFDQIKEALEQDPNEKKTTTDASDENVG
jgi:hypothetical protein